MRSDIAPFEMCKDIFFVGSSRVSVHIIKTEVGLVMIDAGYPDMLEQILCSMNELGLKINDLCAIIHSHGHIDHFGCTAKLKELSGAKTYISTQDNEIVNGHRPLSWAKELGMPEHNPFDCDVLLNDGDVLNFGGVKIRCLLTPGHTQGVLSFFIETGDDQSKVIAAMHGGVGHNSMSADFLNGYGLPLTLHDDFVAGLCRIENERVDLVLGNHPGQNQTTEKLKAVLSGGSALDPTEWKRFIQSEKQRIAVMLEKERMF